MPDEPGLNVDAGIVLADHRESGDFLLVQPIAQRRRPEARLSANVFPDAAEVLFLDDTQVDQAGQCVLDIRHLLRYEFKLVRGQVGRHEIAAPVEYEPARGRYRLDTDPIPSRQVTVVFVTDDLEIHQPKDDEACE